MRTLFLVPVTLCLAVAAGFAQAPVAPPAQTSVPSCPELARALDAVVRNDARLRDWANLNRYRQANAALGTLREGEPRVVFMGDSITDSWQQPRFGSFFVDYFSAMVDEQGLLRADLSEDDLHPNLKGYQIMGPLAEAAVARALSGADPRKK